MPTTRRQFIKSAAASTVGGGTAIALAQDVIATTDGPVTRTIVDTHQHLWDLDRLTLPWLAGAPEKLRQNFTTKEYLAATRGLEMRAVYMEVDVAEGDHVAEAEHVIRLSADKAHPTEAAVIGGRPGEEGFEAYIRRFADSPAVKGVRRVLHGGVPRGHCLEPTFVASMRLLGELDLSFDLCLRPVELADGVRLAKMCPDTRFIVDHCGNADPVAFLAESGATTDKPPAHDADRWRRDIQAFAGIDNVACKISGVVAGMTTSDRRAEQLAPIVNHCLDAFGPDRVVFGGDWPVCLQGATLREWIDTLGEIVAERPADERRKLWHDNAVRLYSLETA